LDLLGYIHGRVHTETSPASTTTNYLVYIDQLPGSFYQFVGKSRHEDRAFKYLSIGFMANHFVSVYRGAFGKENFRGLTFKVMEADVSALMRVGNLKKREEIPDLPEERQRKVPNGALYA
jgi:hypothetical protein